MPHKAYYIDASAIAGLLMGEPSAQALLAKVDANSLRYSSPLLEAEVLSVAKRENIGFESVAEFLDRIVYVQTQSLRTQLEEVLEVGYLREADAYHLATAVFLDSKRDNLVFVSLDQNQKKLAGRMGFKCL
jgi:predicted nucleic acid-binding protein